LGPATRQPPRRRLRRRGLPLGAFRRHRLGGSGSSGFFGGSTTVCRGSLRAASFGRGCRLLGSLGVFAGGTTGVASGSLAADTPRPLGSFSDSTHRKKVSFSSSIAAHPERLKRTRQLKRAQPEHRRALKPRHINVIRRKCPRVPWLWFPHG
jgi:hypothetical protein